MSTFNIPKKVCENLDSLSRRFWWNPKKSEGKFLAWRSWDKLCYPKSQGGLKFKKAKDINNALLDKLAWMISSKRDNLDMNILRSKYRVSEDWLQSKPPKRASPIWKAIELAKKIIVKGACYTIGTWTSINVWTNPWVPWIEGFIPTPKEEVYSQHPILVSHLIDPNLHCWKHNLVKELFNPPSAQAILSIPIPSRPLPDKFIWTPDPKGNFSVKSTYHTSRSHLPSLPHGGIC
ncbi:putative mitochondrial protein AtMg00310 [Castanea sativa]|uniref:putative mitochondrial protein AtMg00310 n=1 Tax=Castanea sativa TaxID=21020 RepID=UPI003F64F10B